MPAVVARGPDDTGHVSAVTFRRDLARIVVSVPAVHVVDEAVAVIVGSVVRNLFLVHEDIVREILMGDVDAAVHDGHDDFVARAIGSAGAEFPGLERADVSSAFARVIQAPLLSEFRIVRSGIALGDVVIRLRVDHAVHPLHLEERLLHLDTFQFHKVQAQRRYESLDHLIVGVVELLTGIIEIAGASQTNHDLPFGIARGLRIYRIRNETQPQQH